MDAKTETYYHLAILACSRPQDIATRKNNQEMGFLLGKYGSFQAIYEGLKLQPSPEIQRKLAREQQFIQDLNLEFKISTIKDKDFPEQLRAHEECTPVIYYRGNLDLLKRDCIAVVGTRNSLSPQELADSKRVLADLIRKKYVILSGLAKGCDTLGHRAGLQTGTVGVLGTPINKYYPSENAELQEQIAREHLLISQFPIGIERFLYYMVQPLNFAKRNQTTVVLANKGVVVLKTADAGGTQNAIRESQYFQRPLYALRANFGPENSWTEKFEWIDYAGGLLKQAK